MKQIWIVYINSGCFEDFFQRIVGVFDLLEKANKFKKRKEILLDKYKLHKNGINSEKDNYKYRTTRKLYKLFSIAIDFNGAWYTIDGPITINKERK